MTSMQFEEMLQKAVDTVQQAIEMFGKEMVDLIVNQAMVADWKVVLKELGYENTQFLIVRHSEKSNPHSHCVLNMVDNDGKRIKEAQRKISVVLSFRITGTKQAERALWRSSRSLL